MLQGTRPDLDHSSTSSPESRATFHSPSRTQIVQRLTMSWRALTSTELISTLASMAVFLTSGYL